MKEGDIVTFKNLPNMSTPGVTEDAIIFGIEFTGVVVAEKIKKSFPGPFMVDENNWCEVLWSNSQITQCYKYDLKVWPTNQ